MLLCSLLTLAWLHVCCGRDLAQASSSSDCTTVNTAAELNDALPTTGTDARRLCLDPTDDSALEFKGHAPLAIKEGTDVFLDCAGRQVKSYTEQGSGIATIESNASLTLENCNWDSFNGAEPPMEIYTGVPGVQLAKDGQLQISNSFARMECVNQGLLLLGDGRDDSAIVVSPLSVTAVAKSDDGETLARTIVSAKYAILETPGGTLEEGQEANADVHNVTLWCSADWATAEPVAMRALRSAADVLSQLAAPAPPSPEGSSSSQFRQFVIVTFVLACVVGAVVAGAIVLYIRRKRAAERHVDVSHVYASGGFSPVGNNRLAWLKRKLPGSGRVNSHERTALTGASAGDSRAPPQLLQTSGGSGSVESGRVQSAIHKVISFGASSHRNASVEGASQNGGSSTKVLGSPAFVPTHARKSPAAEASGSSLMPPTSTQNALFVCNEDDEGVPDDSSGTPLKKLFSNTANGAGAQAHAAVHASPGAVTSMVPASHNTHTGSRDGVTAESCRAASGSMASSGAQVRRGVGSLRSEVANAVTQLQDALRSDLQEDQLEVYDVLGRGGFGTVYYGQWRGLSVAIKTLVFQSDSADNQLNKVASEVAIASNLVHTNIVATYSHDVCPVSENPVSNSNSNNELGIFKFYLIQEFCNGGSLRGALGKGLFGAEQLPRRWNALMAVLREVAAGMNYMHEKRICHGDLNPSNILLKYDEVSHGSLSGALKKTAAVCKIADFGMARRMHGNRSYASNVRQGTPFYISPETINQHRLHRSSDVYAFGVIMWELMRGVPVFVTRQNTRNSRTNDMSTEAVEDSFQQHPDFPYLPACVPLTYTLTMKACLSERPDDRPSFAHLSVLLQDLLHEVAQGSFINSLGKPEDSAAVQRVPDGKLLSTSVAPDSEAMHKTSGMQHNMTTLSHALMGIEGPGTMPVSGSMPLSHSILLTGFKSTVMSMQAPAAVPEGDSEGAPSPGTGGRPQIPPLSLATADNSRTIQGMLFGPLSTKRSSRVAAASRDRPRGGANGAVMISPRGQAPAQPPNGALGKIRSLQQRVQSSASGVLRTMGRDASKALSTTEQQPSDSDSTAELGGAAYRANRAARAQHRPLGGAAAAAEQQQQQKHQRQLRTPSASPGKPRQQKQPPEEPPTRSKTAKKEKPRKGRSSVKNQAREIEARSSGTPPPALHRAPIPSPRAQEKQRAAAAIGMSPSAPLDASPDLVRATQHSSAMATMPPSMPQARAAADETERGSPGASQHPPRLQIPASEHRADVTGDTPEHSPRTLDVAASAVLATPQPPAQQVPAGGNSDRLFSDQSSFMMGAGGGASETTRTGSVTFDCRNDVNVSLGGTLSVTQSSLMQGESTLSANAALPQFEGEAAAAASESRVRASMEGGSALGGAETLSTQYTGWSAMHEQSTMREPEGGGARPPPAGGSVLQDASCLGRDTAQESSFVSAVDASPMAASHASPHAYGTGSVAAPAAEEGSAPAAPAVMVTRKRLKAVSDHHGAHRQSRQPHHVQASPTHMSPMSPHAQFRRQGSLEARSHAARVRTG